ncbi:DUF5453 family protein [Mycoplasma sp. E35C]|uniref:DUF5453 family protein n=1 Tax=Mycoplasma sp. E35C TaxID=2801918 RepID=UPI001CA3B27B|nr:DUF5453 family protein [Mycoplasma sp. E35C]QZX48941.1 DUF5453 family protein [Mycoplasma sp. E35C]
MKLRKWRNHYITVIANALVFIGFAFNAYLVRFINPNTQNNPYNSQAEILFAPAIVGIVLGSIMLYVDIRYFLKDFPYKKFHYDKKFNKIYVIGLSIFLFNLLIGIIFILVAFLFKQNIVELRQNVVDNQPDKINEAIKYYNYQKNIVYASVAVVGIICIMSMTIIRLARFKIELALELRKNQTQASDKPVNSDDKSVILHFDDHNDNKKNKKEGGNPPSETNPPKPTQVASSGMNEL